MQTALQRAWLRRGALACALWPLSLLFRVVVAARRTAYRAHWFKSEQAGVPIVIVGNVIAGGSGKTPIVQVVVQHLKDRGLAVGIVSRGYGRRTRDCREVRVDSAADEAGDEPLLLVRTTAVPMFVASERMDAVRALLRAYPATKVIVSDDGLQHYAMARDIEICVFDERGTGNGWLLPAGPLREPWPRPVDLILQPAMIERSLASEAIRADGSRKPLEELKGRPLTALAAIAKPQAFFEMLRARGLDLALTIALPDHDDLASLPPLEGDIVCTEKDAVKLWRTRPGAWAVPLKVNIDSAFWTAFDAKLSSLDGPQTA
jgi:tetraacyldisaccharide 4'-kinase